MVCGISFVFRGISLPKCCFLYLESRSYSKKSVFFRKKTKSFDSKNEVLAPLTLRFFGKRRRFSTVKTPCFSDRSLIYLQLAVRQLITKPSNTRKISMRKLSTENSQAMKLKELKIVKLQCLRKGWIDKECKEGTEPFCENGERCLKGYSLFFLFSW